MDTPTSAVLLPAPLPAILCLHGAGTSGLIFRLQARTFLRLLQSRFRFIFVDAPFESLPGPGALPTYADMKPYLWWHCDEASAGRFDISLEEIRRRRREVRGLLAKELADPDVVGIMAFSQGARVATGLCLDEELGRRIKFAVLFAATFPALEIGEAGSSGSRSMSDSDPDADTVTPSLAKLNIPSVHVQGTSDPWAAEGDRLKTTYFAESFATLVRFAGGHTCPVAKDDAERVVKAVVAAWRLAKAL
jgi:pimeloyl-ACP methyl ester carboxylesterase